MADGCSCADALHGISIPVIPANAMTNAERRAAIRSIFSTPHLRWLQQQRARRLISLDEVPVVRLLKRLDGFGRGLELTSARHRGAREIAENRRIRLARRPTV